jgi:hypothetical protein
MRDSAVVLICVLLGCASSGSTKTDYVTAPGADLAAYASFGWQAAGDATGAGNAPLSIADANFQNAIRAQLVEKGYREVPSGADLLVSFEAAGYMAEKVKSPMRIGVGLGSWGGNVGGGVGASAPVGSEEVVATQETRLTIRAVDQRSNKEVWLGTATGDMKQGLDVGAVEKAVASTLKGFPARRE